MTLLFEFKEKLKLFYGKYGAYLNPLLKFCLALVVFVNINLMLGFLPFLNNVFVLLIFALLCSILPMSAMVVVGSIMIVGHCYVLGIEVAAFALVLLLMIVMLFLRFAPHDALALVLTPLAFEANVPGAIPVGLGLLSNAGAAISSVCGVVVYYFMKLVQEKAVMLKNGEVTEMAQRLNNLLDGLLQNSLMWIHMIAFVTIVLAVYFIRRMSADYSWSFAVLVGVVLYPVIIVAGSFFMEREISVVLLVASTVLTLILMIVLQFFVFSVDYSRSEFLQFEDDEYYYYVKAVPKIKISEKNRSVKSIQEEVLLDDYEKNLERSLEDIHIR